jgi:hypothetical protein
MKKTTKITLGLVLVLCGIAGGLEIYTEIFPPNADRRPTIASVEGTPNVPSLGRFLGWSGNVSVRGGFTLVRCQVGGQMLLALPGDSFSAKENDPVDVWRYSWCPGSGSERLEALVAMPAGSQLWKGNPPP